MRGSALLVGLGLCLGGCQMPVPRIGEPQPSLPNKEQENRYRALLKYYSAHQEVYAHLDTQILSAMTYQSWTFRQARVEREAAFRVIPTPVVEQMLAKEKADFDQFHEFFFGVHVNDRRYDDFGKPDSIWRVALVVGDREVLPISLERVGRYSIPLSAYYRYLDDFWVGYWIRFPRETQDGPIIPKDVLRFQVVVASALGKATFNFPRE